MGIQQPGTSFEYGQAIGSINHKTYIKIMTRLAENAQQLFAKTGQITVIVQDRGSVDSCNEVRAYYPQKGKFRTLYLFSTFLFLTNEFDLI